MPNSVLSHTDRVITRYHLVLSVPAVTIRGMAGDQETVTAAAAVTAGGDLVPRAGARPPGPAAIAAELLARTRAELPVGWPGWVSGRGTAGRRRATGPHIQAPRRRGRAANVHTADESHTTNDSGRPDRLP